MRAALILLLLSACDDPAPNQPMPTTPRRDPEADVFKERIEKKFAEERARTLDDAIRAGTDEWKMSIGEDSYGALSSGIESEYARGYGGFIGAPCAFVGTVVSVAGPAILDVTADRDREHVIRVMCPRDMPANTKSIGVVGFVIGSVGRGPGGLRPKVEAKAVMTPAELRKAIARLKRAAAKEPKVAPPSGPILPGGHTE